MGGDRIIVFTMDKGVVETFAEIRGASIYPLRKGGAGEVDKVGGNRNATSFDGIENAGSALIPPEGLMAGEPGRIVYWEEDKSLLLTLHLDEDAFVKLAEKLASSLAGSVHINVLCELFESAAGAMLGEPGRSEYGLLLRPKGIQYARARLDSITVFDQERKLIAWDARGGEEGQEKEPGALETAVAGIAARLDRLTWLVGGIAIMVLTILLWTR